MKWQESNSKLLKYCEITNVSKYALWSCNVVLQGPLLGMLYFGMAYSTQDAGTESAEP